MKADHESPLLVPLNPYRDASANLARLHCADTMVIQSFDHFSKTVGHPARGLKKRDHAKHKDGSLRNPHRFPLALIDTHFDVSTTRQGYKYKSRSS